MRQVLAESSRVLCAGGHLVLVAGSSRTCRLDFQTPIYLRQIAEGLGFAVRLCLIDSIQSRGLMTKRNSTASVIAREWVILLQKQDPAC